MTTFIKVNLKKSDDQTNMDKYTVATNVTKYHNKYIIINLPKNHNFKIRGDKAIILCKYV